MNNYKDFFCCECDHYMELHNIKKDQIIGICEIRKDKVKEYDSGCENFTLEGEEDE